MEAQEQESRVKSLSKAMNVLECFSVEHPELGISDIARMLSLPKSTIHNIISTFCKMGYISHNPENSKYHLGVRLLHFGYIINTHMNIRKFLLPYLQKIAAAVNETIYLGIPYGSDVLYIESLTPSGTQTRNILGECAPMFCTGVGKAMLAFLSDKEARIQQTVFTRYTDNTIIDAAALRENLRGVQQKGYAVDNMEHEYGIKCVAVPVFGHDNDIIAAVSISAPSLRLDQDNVVRYARMIREILEPIQHSL